MCPSHSLSMKSSIPECAERSLGISTTPLMHLRAILITKATQLTTNYIMLMVSASLIEKDYHADPFWDGSVLPVAAVTSTTHLVLYTTTTTNH